MLKFGTENALKKMLEVLDNFERGKKALEKVLEKKNLSKNVYDILIFSRKNLIYLII